ncbi:uncharacterized protein PADG_08565 [Paracoccidioides brasiliensis Pb18]|uniref:Uncharacterized protein n=1 Tax=Paracoccidioides brasiliensis (strain Pb18) TaxID=502780 RepID=C1GMS1_PARBD|nr:uncharacterized protein PADG_08565 [Paracoccidioides brasiliensis Pb18]EEH44923.1 hypothetical protein PADG_08565 [Paracoccidioides brasiliensis Pb18]
MPPIRRYLRISKYSVLECRVYLENPTDSRWLLDARDPALPRVFNSIRPLILPKLREEDARARAKKKLKPVKDVLSEDDFEVSIFLRDGGTSHSIVTKDKSFNNQTSKVQSNSNELIGMEHARIPIAYGPVSVPSIIPEGESESTINLQDIPTAIPSTSNIEGIQSSNQHRQCQRNRTETSYDRGNISDSQDTRVAKRKKASTEPSSDIIEDGKKLGLTTRYRGFTIRGKILCLLITRKGDRARQKLDSASASQALMEKWISTQAPQDFEEN